MFAASPYLHARREGRLPLAPRRLLRLVPPRRLLFVRVPRRGTWVGSARTAPGAAAPLPGRTSAPVHRLPLVVPQPVVAVPGGTGRGGLVGVEGGLGVGGAIVLMFHSRSRNNAAVTVAATLSRGHISGSTDWLTASLLKSMKKE